MRQRTYFVIALLVAVFFTAMAQTQERPHRRDTLRADERLKPNEQLVSADGVHTAIYQSDGNFVVYGPPPDRARDSHPRAIWASDTGNRPSRFLVMQADGNLVIYNCHDFKPECAVWSTGTQGHPHSRLVMQNDGNLVIYQGERPIWDTMRQSWRERR